MPKTGEARRRKRWRKATASTGPFVGPYGVLELDLPGAWVPLHAGNLGSCFFTDVDGERVVFVLQAPGSGPSALDELAGTSNGAGVRARLSVGERRGRDEVAAGPSEFLASRARRLMAYLREELASATLEVEGWRAELDRPDWGPAEQSIRSVPGGLVARHRVAAGDPIDLSSFAYLPAERPWIVHVLARQRWLDRNERWLLRPRFGRPRRMLLLPFVARALDLLAERVPAGWRARLAAPEDRADGMGWSFELDVDVGEGYRWRRNLETMYLAYLNEGATLEDLVESTIAPAGTIAELRDEMARGRPVELEVGRVLPVLRNAEDVEKLDGGAHLLAWPVTGDLVVTLAVLQEFGDQMAWTLLTEEIVRRTVHRPETLLRHALVNAAERLAARGGLPPPAPWPGRGPREWTFVALPGETCSFLLAPEGRAWADGFLRDEAQVCVPAREEYLFGPPGEPPPDLGPILERTRFPISSRAFRWADLRDGLSRLDVRPRR